MSLFSLAVTSAARIAINDHSTGGVWEMALPEARRLLSVVQARLAARDDLRSQFTEASGREVSLCCPADLLAALESALAGAIRRADNYLLTAHLQ